MVKEIMHRKATVLLITLWIILFLLDKKLNLLSLFSGRGMRLIGHEYYRFATGPLLHVNLVHLLVNIIALYWAGYFAEKHIGSIRYLAFGLIGSILSEMIYSCIFKYSDNNFGGSVWVFLYIGLLFILHISKPGFPKFRLGTRYGNWIVGYSIIGNIPFLSFIPWFSFLSFGTVIIHLCALAVGIILGLLGIYFKLL